MEVIFKIEDKPFAGGFSEERLKVNALLVKKHNDSLKQIFEKMGETCVFQKMFKWMS